MMNIGIRLHDTAPGTLRERLASAKAQGFSCVHLALSKALPDFDMMKAPSLLTDDLAGEVRNALRETDLDCAVLGCYLRLATMGNDLQHTQEIYRAHLRFAKKIGARVVGTETPPGEGANTESLELFLKNIAPVVRWAEEEDALLAIEPVACHIVNTPERAEYVLERLKSDNLRIILDAVNLLTRDNYLRADQIIEEAIRRLGDRVSVLHMKDFTVNPEAFMVKSQACGTGQMRYEKLLRFARTRSLPMTLEDTTPENAEQARLFLEGIETEE